MLITKTITEDIGSFATKKDYLVIGGGVQNIQEGPKTCINVLETTQEKYDKLPASQVLKLALEMAVAELEEAFNYQPFNPYVSSLSLLPTLDRNYDVFICARAYTPNKVLMSSKTYTVLIEFTWRENLEKLCNEIYNDLLNQMSSEDIEFDPKFFGVDFNSFDIM
jgi:hypothetical protein